jgi:hypothetical protein
MANDPCAICGGTGTLRCNHCGGGGINQNSSLLDDQCHGCKGKGKERCQECRGTGEWRPATFFLPARAIEHGNLARPGPSSRSFN